MRPGSWLSSALALPASARPGSWPSRAVARSLRVQPRAHPVRPLTRRARRRAVRRVQRARPRPFPRGAPVAVHRRVNLLVLAALTDATGNAVTARRIAAHLEGAHRVTLVDAVGTTAASLRDLVEAEAIDAAIGVHALLAGPFLRALGLPYALIFGGTDLYEPTHELHHAQMARAVAGAARLIAFSPENAARAEWLWPTVRGRVEHLPQAVDATIDAGGFSLRAALDLDASDVLVVLPTGIRRVKDPLHVVEAFSAWNMVEPRAQLAVVGAVLEPDYADAAVRVLRGRAGVHYVPALPRPHMLAAMREADVVLNTSLSEGMCGSLLEAMRLGTPVVARRNAGNESIVVHGHTGLLYDSPSEVVLWSRALVGSEGLRGRIAGTARARMEAVHSPEREREAYLRIAAELAPSAPSVTPAPASPAPPVDELSSVVGSAARVGLDPEAIEAQRAVVARLADAPDLAATIRRLAALLGTAPPSVAIAEIDRLALARTLGRAAARELYLLLALMQVPAAEARLAARGVGPDIVRATLGDLALWAHHFRAQTGTAGITLEILEWAQRYLRGELFRMGPLQFDLRPFAAPLRVFRHRATRRLSAVTVDGWPIDLAAGKRGGRERPAHDPAEWDVALEPGSPMLEMWIPGAASMVTLREVAGSMREAYSLFARLSPATMPVGVHGESWRLDPQVLAFLPPAPGVHDLQRACCLYPSSLPEDKTIRRLFGPDVTRADLESMPRDRMTDLQRKIAGFLDDPAATLRARGGFVLREELERIPEWR